MKSLVKLLVVWVAMVFFGAGMLYAQPMKLINQNSDFSEGLKGWKVEKNGPGDFTIKVEKQGNMSVLHIIRKNSHRKRGYVAISQEWDPPVKGDRVYINLHARINYQQLKTSGRWSKKDPSSACYPIHLYVYTPEKLIYDFGISTRDNPPGYPGNYTAKPDKEWFFFDSVPTSLGGSGVKKVVIRFEGYDLDVEVDYIKVYVGEQM